MKLAWIAVCFESKKKNEYTRLSSMM